MEGPSKGWQLVLRFPQGDVGESRQIEKTAKAKQPKTTLLGFKMYRILDIYRRFCIQKCTVRLQFGFLRVLHMFPLHPRPLPRGEGARIRFIAREKYVGGARLGGVKRKPCCASQRAHVDEAGDRRSEGAGRGRRRAGGGAAGAPRFLVTLCRVAKSNEECVMVRRRSPRHSIKRVLQKCHPEPSLP
jgi:hypothetical protein